MLYVCISFENFILCLCSSAWMMKMFQCKSIKIKSLIHQSDEGKQPKLCGELNGACFLIFCCVAFCDIPSNICYI